MELTEYFQPGMYKETTFEVTEEHSAIQLGSGSLRVLATPMMIRFMEITSHRLLEQHLPDGFSSVGYHLDIHHQAPTPINNPVRVRAEILELNKFKVSFSVKAWDDIEQVGEGLHQRVVIDLARFMKRVEAKMKALSGSK
ncbi:MAG: thioesterase family protein [Anaerolineales bacterium]